MWICAVMVAVALIAAVATGNPAYLLPAGGCVLMMGAMLWMMAGMGGRGGRSDPR